VGDINAAELQKKVSTAFSQLPVGRYQDTLPPPLSFSSPTIAVTARDIPTNYVQGTYSAPAPNAPDIYAMRVAISILRNRIFEEVRIKRNLSYAPDASLNEYAANTGNIYVTAVDANQSVRVMLDEIAKLQNENVSTDELKATAQSFLTSHYLDQETNAGQAGELARYELIGGGWRNSASLLDRLRAVTPQDVRRVANTYIKNLQFIIVGDPAKIDRQVFLRQARR
jgi:predicted Zn-dependent peptidase